LNNKQVKDAKARQLPTNVCTFLDALAEIVVDRVLDAIQQNQEATAQRVA
jgi:hypothetical protein